MNTARRYLRTVLPDHCSLNAPWFTLGARGGSVRGLHRIAARALATHNKDLQPLSPLHRLPRALGGVLWPVNALVRSLLVMPVMGKLVEQRFDVGLLTQLQGMILASNRYNLAPKAYYKYRLFDRSLPWLPEQYFQEHELAVLLRLARERSDSELCELLDNKRRFWEACSRAKVPCVPVVVAIDADSGALDWQVAERRLPQADLVVKRTSSAEGDGFECWHHDPTGSCWRFAGREYDEKGLLNSLRQRSSDLGRDAIVQPRIRNHAALLPVAGRGLSTARIVTALSGSEQAQVIAATLRMPVGENLVDNVSQGGIAAGVDLESGALGPALGKDASLGWYDLHPDSGVKLADISVPLWAEATQLCITAHCRWPAAPAVGWDVAVTDDGPLLVEANTMWASAIQEAPGAMPLGATVLADTLHRWLTEERPTKQATGSRISRQDRGTTAESATRH